jgi:hypothetical protein
MARWRISFQESIGMPGGWPLIAQCGCRCQPECGDLPGTRPIYPARLELSPRTGFLTPSDTEESCISRKTTCRGSVCLHSTKK